MGGIEGWREEEEEKEWDTGTEKPQTDTSLLMDCVNVCVYTFRSNTVCVRVCVCAPMCI